MTRPAIAKPAKISSFFLTTFVFIAITASFLAYAGGGTSGFQSRLLHVLDHWWHITPGEGAVGAPAYEELKELNRLNKKIAPEVESKKDQLANNLVEVFKTQKTITESVLKEKHWQKGIDAVKTKMSSKGLDAALFRDAPKKSTENKGDLTRDNEEGTKQPPVLEPPKQPPTLSSDPKHLQGTLDTLRDEIITFDKSDNRWALRNTDKRAVIDENFVINVLTSFGRQEMLDAFAERLVKSMSTIETSGFRKLYAELIMLHIYLKPTEGFGSIHLGLNAEGILYRSNTDKHFETEATKALSDDFLPSAILHEQNLAQALKQKQVVSQLLLSLQKIVNTHGYAFLTLNNTKGNVQTAFALTAVLFDLFQISELSESIRPLAKKFRDLSYLWDMRSCRYESRFALSRERENKIDECMKEIWTVKSTPRLLEAVIKEQITKKRPSELNTTDKTTAFQLTYGAIALRKMARTPKTSRTTVEL